MREGRRDFTGAKSHSSLRGQQITLYGVGIASLKTGEFPTHILPVLLAHFPITVHLIYTHSVTKSFISLHPRISDFLARRPLKVMRCLNKFLGHLSPANLHTTSKFAYGGTFIVGHNIAGARR